VAALAAAVVLAAVAALAAVVVLAAPVQTPPDLVQTQPDLVPTQPVVRPQTAERPAPLLQRPPRADWSRFEIGNAALEWRCLFMF
jgi:hypothetical protein